MKPQDTQISRRVCLMGLIMMTTSPARGFAQARDIWGAREAYQALTTDKMRIVDVRTRQEWLKTGVGQGIWPISMHEERFPERLFAAKKLAENRPIGIICATGGRSGSILRALQKAGYEGYVDISEGMLGSQSGAGWISLGLPLIELELALSSLPKELL